MVPVVRQADDVPLFLVDAEGEVVAGDPSPAQRVELLLHGVEGLDHFPGGSVY
jgi:hypothetical protein